MHTVILRIYEELCDHLSEDRRKRAFECRFEGAATVEAILRAVGIPLCEVDLILKNGESIDPARQVCDGDRISVYPVFESIDIHEVSRVRSEPLRRPLFVAGPGLERLAVCLRILGFDALSCPRGSAEDLVRLAGEENRILLCTDDRQAPAATRVLVVTAGKPRLQAAEILRRLDLCRLIRPFGTCPRCNKPLQPDGNVFRCGSCGSSFCASGGLRRILADMEALLTQPGA